MSNAILWRGRRPPSHIPYNAARKRGTAIYSEPLPLTPCQPQIPRDFRYSDSDRDFRSRRRPACRRSGSGKSSRADGRSRPTPTCGSAGSSVSRTRPDGFSDRTRLSRQAAGRTRTDSRTRGGILSRQNANTPPGDIVLRDITLDPASVQTVGPDPRGVHNTPACRAGASNPGNSIGRPPGPSLLFHRCAEAYGKGVCSRGRDPGFVAAAELLAASIAAPCCGPVHQENSQ
jgi:hypothetical protein